MSLCFPFPNGGLFNKKVDEKHLSIFAHEYIHFLQDISSYVGLYNAYICSEYIRGSINEIYKYSKGIIKVPICFNDNKHNINLNKFINQSSMGTNIDIQNVFPIRIQETNKKAPYQNVNLKQVFIYRTGGKPLVFGTRAIMESMAYLIEKLITFGNVSAPDYPYNAAQIVINKIYPDFGYNPLNIIALCDMSLQFSEPGKIFYETLCEYKFKKYSPSEPEEIIDEFNARVCTQQGKKTNLKQSSINMGFLVGDCLCAYLEGSQYRDFHNAIYALLGFGMRQRLMDPYFMLKIARGGNMLKNVKMMSIVREIGTPIIEDSNHDFWIVRPQFPLKKFSLRLLPAILEIYKLLSQGNSICEMIDFCEKSKIAIDNRCYNEPWARCTDMELCPYAELWKRWGLTGYIPQSQTM